MKEKEADNPSMSVHSSPSSTKKPGEGKNDERGSKRKENSSPLDSQA